MTDPGGLEVAGPHSGWPYPTQHPNKPEEEIDEEAARAVIRLARGVPAVKVAEELGISRSTLYNRLQLVNGRLLPGRDLAKAIMWARTEELFGRLMGLLDGDISNADAIRAIAEGRQLAARQAALLKLDEAVPEPPPDAELSLEDQEALAEWQVAEDGQEP